MNELRFALRQLQKSPSFTIIAVLALAIGIGANTAIFSVVNAVLLKPLPFPKPEQLVAIGSVEQQGRAASSRGLDSLSYPDFFDFRAQTKCLAAIAVYRSENYALAGSSEAQSLRGECVSAEFFNVLGVRPQVGRTFTPEEEKAGGGPIGLTAVLSHEFWQRQFKGAANAVGSVLLLNGEPHIIIGAMPPGFQFPIESDPVEVYTTISTDAVSLDADAPTTQQRGDHRLNSVGRLKPGVSARTAEAELRAIAATLEHQYPDTNTGFSAAVKPLREEMVGDVSSALYVLFGAVVCVLLIASANVANLLLARATARAKEIALRSALGASRGRIIRQLLTESLVLSGAGGLLGLIFAAWGTDILIALVPENIPRITEIKLDAVVLGFTLLVSLATGVLFGLAPAVEASRLDLQSALNECGRGASTSGAARNHLRSSLVIAEVALALILLTGAGLLLQSFARLSRVDPGVQPNGLFTAYVSLPPSVYKRPDDAKNFFDQLLPRLSALPGVQAASTIYPMPLSGRMVTTSFDLEEHPLPKGQQPSSPARIAGRDYFRTMGIPLVRGRLFNDSDQRGAKEVMIVNQRFAEKYLPGEDPIGKRIAPGWTVDAGESPMREIIGIVSNVKQRSLREETTPEMYLPATQAPVGSAYLVVRTATSDPSKLTAAVRAQLGSVDAAVPLTRVRVFDDYLARALARPRFNALLLATFAGVALLLTAIGIYGVMAYNVVQRRQEIGIRMALGAQQGDVLRLVIGGGMKLTAVGVVLGLTAAFALTKSLTALLYGVKAFDAPTLAAVAVLLCSVALLACWVPARRALAVNPVVALREG
jgi:putative ABC transport system permease protein